MIRVEPRLKLASLLCAAVKLSPGAYTKSPQVQTREMTVRRGYSVAVYSLCLLASFSVWLIAIRTPLWLDETISFWQINGGVAHILSRQGGLSALAVPAYPYILWFFSRILGTSELALRVPSILAMLAAVYLLYRTARELFDRDVALLAIVLFCVNPIVAFAAIDARPYAFAALAISASIDVLVRLRQSDSNWLAAGLGILAAVTVWFHFLFAVMTPALLIGFFIVKLGGRSRDLSPDAHHNRNCVPWRQLGAATAGYVVAFLPLIPGLLYMFRTRTDHPFDGAPELGDLLGTIAPGWCLPVLAGTAFIGLIIAGLRTNRSEPQTGTGVDFWRILLCQVLALIPLLILYVVSVATPLHIFVVRYRLVAVAGISVCWAVLVSGFKPRALQAVFCIGVVGLTTFFFLRLPQAHQHGYTWKYAIEAAQQNASLDDASVLICSDLPEADHMPLPIGQAVKDSNLFAPLSYYKLNAPVVAMPRALNDSAKQIGANFIEGTAPRKRFLAMGYFPSYRTLQWLIGRAAPTHQARQLGTFDGIAVLEFVPRTH